MIWLTWRQHRIEALFIVVLLGLFSYVFIKDGMVIHAAFQQTHMAECLARPTCDTEPFYTQTYGLSSLLSWFSPFWLALFAAMFIGAPLVAREYEHRTHYLAWSQSITPTRWLLIKLAMLSGVVLLASAVLSSIMTWWSEPERTIQGDWDLYNASGLMFPAHILFGLVLGVAVGTFIRRTIPSMAATFLLYFLLVTVMISSQRYLLPPMSRTVPFNSPNSGPLSLPGEMIVDQTFADSQGRLITDMRQYCDIKLQETDPGYWELDQRCKEERHTQWYITYQPAERFWLLQFIESGILLVLTIGLALLALWQVKRRLN